MARATPADTAGRTIGRSPCEMPAKMPTAIAVTARTPVAARPTDLRTVISMSPFQPGRGLVKALTLNRVCVLAVVLRDSRDPRAGVAVHAGLGSVGSAVPVVEVVGL